MDAVRESGADMENRDESDYFKPANVKEECLLEKPYSSDASEPYLGNIALYDHEQEEFEKLFQCDICSQTMPTYEALMEHRDGHYRNYNINCHFCPESLADKSALLEHTQLFHFAEASLRYGSYETFLLYMNVKRQEQRSNEKPVRPRRKVLELKCEQCEAACEYRISISSIDVVRRHAKKVCRCTETVPIEYNTSTERLETLNGQKAVKKVRTEATDNIEGVNCSVSKRAKKISPFFIKVEETELNEHYGDLESSVPRTDSVPENFAHVAVKPESHLYQPSGPNNLEPRLKTMVKTENILAEVSRYETELTGTSSDRDSLKNVNEQGQACQSALQTIVKTEISDSCVDQRNNAYVKTEFVDMCDAYGMK